MDGHAKTVLITGASGFLGKALGEYLLKQGYKVRALVRQPEANPEIARWAQDGIYQCNLPNEIDEAAFTGEVSALIHCAYAPQTMDHQQAEAINITGSKQLLELARRHQVGRFVFISSFAALPEAESYYGRSKMHVERLLDLKRDLVLRPSLIVGRGGLFQTLLESIRRVPVVPLFYGGRQKIQTIWIEDVCQAIDHALKKKLIGIYKLAEDGENYIADFYQHLAAHVGRRCFFLPLPGAASLLILRCLEQLKCPLPITSENLLGLKHMRTFDVSEDIKVLDIQPKSLEQSLQLLGESP